MAVVELTSSDGSLDDCFRTALCALASPAKAALRATLEGLRAAALGQLVLAQGVLAQLRVLAVPTELLVQAIAVAKDTLLSSLSFDFSLATPSVGSVAATCIPLAALRVCAGQEIDKVIKALSDFNISAGRQLIALRNAELRVEELQQAIANYDLTLDFLAQCP